MLDPDPRFDAVPGLPTRRRLALALGGTLVCGVIAATIAHEQTVASESNPLPDAEAATPAPSEPARDRVAAVPPSDPQTDAVERLRESVDLYLDARALALRRLDDAQTAGVDPEVLSAMSGVLGIPGTPSAPPEPVTQETRAREL